MVRTSLLPRSHGSNGLRARSPGPLSPHSNFTNPECRPVQRRSIRLRRRTSEPKSKLQPGRSSGLSRTCACRLRLDRTQRLVSRPFKHRCAWLLLRCETKADWSLNLALPRRCCPSAQTCVDTPSLSPRVSCCPHGSTCGQVGTVAQQHQPPPNANHNPPGSVVVLGGPVIVQASPEHPVPPSTVFYSPPPTVVQVATPTLAVETEAVVVPAGAVVVAGQSSSLLPGPYCSTLTAKGPGLPTARAGGCGTILVVNTGGRLRPAGDGAGWTWTRDWRIGVIVGSLYLGVIGW